MRRLLPTLFALVLLLPSSGVLRAQEGEREEIVDFDVRVELGDGGVMTVTETIRVRALGREIRRGIFRDVPTRFPRPSGFGTVVAPLEVVSVTRDGRAEPYRVETVRGPSERSGVRVRIGDADVMLDPGLHTYRLTYRTERWMRFGGERDSLAWNVTGNGWGFPIRRAAARLVLPEPVSADEVRLQAWTGPEGATDENATSILRPREGEADFETTAPLAPGEGLTVEIGLPAGVIAPPDTAQQRAWMRLDWGGYLEAGVLCLLVLGVYLALWIRVGRDPDGRPLVIRYHPPAGFSPAALGYVRNRGFESRQLTASLVSLAVSGALRLERPDDDTWTIASTGNEGAGLESDERRLLKDLTRGSRRLTLTGSTNSRLRSATKTLRRGLERALEGRYFELNRRWFAAGLAASLVSFALLAFRYRFDVGPESLFLGVWLTGWSAGTGALLVQVVRAWRELFNGTRSAIIGAPFITLFALPFTGAWIVVAWFLYRMVPGHLVMAAIGLGLLNVVFFHLLERPTLKGRGVLDELEGFRRFLEGTERDRFDRMQEPDAALELFERYLPHAIALDVENRWAERFDEVLRASKASGASSGASVSPSWFVGASSFSGAGGFTQALGSSLGSTLSSSSAAPSSSGGGSSGGSSGGGGGGGGGGGW